MVKVEGMSHHNSVFLLSLLCIYLVQKMHNSTECGTKHWESG